jgi:hypothetical protein
MSSTTYPTISLISDSRRPRSASHWPLLPILDLTSAHLDKSIRIAINSLPFWMHLSYYNVFLDVSYVLPQRRSQDSSWCTQERVWRVNCIWTRLPCSHLPISQPCDYTEHHHVFVMFHITYDIIVQTLSPFVTSIIKNMQSFPELPVGSTDWISLTLILTWIWPISLTRMIYLPNHVLNPTQGLTWSHPHILATED